MIHPYFCFSPVV